MGSVDASMIKGDVWETRKRVGTGDWRRPGGDALPGSGKVHVVEYQIRMTD